MPMGGFKRSWGGKHMYEHNPGGRQESEGTWLLKPKNRRLDEKGKTSYTSGGGLTDRGKASLFTAGATTAGVTSADSLKNRKKVRKNMTESAFGVDHGGEQEVSKASNRGGKSNVAGKKSKAGQLKRGTRWAFSTVKTKG